MTGALYVLRNVEKRFAGHPAVAISELDLEAGGVIALVGPNGAGKTTLLRLLAFVDEPTSGTIRFLPPPGSQRIVYVEQAPFLFRGTVRSNVGYGLRAAGVARDERERRVAEALDSVGLGGFAGRRASTLSGGERRRVALARALVLRPEVLLLDEPFSEVDRASAARIEDRLIAPGERGTVIFTTHDLAQAHRLAGRVLSLAAGRMSPIPLVNAFRGTVRTDGEATSFVTGEVVLDVAHHVPGATLAAIDPEGVVVSAGPLQSSARNSFAGTIVQVESRNGSFHLTVDCGVRVVAAVTRQSYEELGLNVGRTAWVTFKSTAVHLY